MNPKRVCILLSTYNGEKYLEEQIESILKQESVTVSILARDDGSKDRTCEILSEYKEKGILTFLPCDKNYGPALSFMKLLYSADEYDYYAFADQDDIWKPRKLIAGIEKIESLGENIPALYASNQLLFIDGKEEQLRFRENPNYTLSGIICGNKISGCTMIFNNRLKNILGELKNRPSDNILKIRMHDTWIAAVAALCGKIIYDPESYIDYRIHKNNTVGIKAESVSGRIKRCLRIIQNPEMKNGRRKLAAELERIPTDNIQEKTIVSSFAHARERKAALLKNNEILNNCGENKMVFALKVMFNWI